ncbi:MULTISPECIES: acyl carrier protein [Amycolatopsis]|uniref:acyl carrier protein n=1 Tax=Amycolatopsis sp. cg13 TaxID=3238807 RepID=UPI00352553F2
MYDKIKEIMTSKYEIAPAKIVPEATLEELGLDSLDVVELAMAIQDEWGTRVTDDELNSAGTVEAVVGLIQSRVALI